MINTLRNIYRKMPGKPHAFRIMRTFNLPEKIYKHLHFEDQIKINYKEANFLINHYGFKVENELFWAGYGNSWEANSLKLWYELSKVHQRIADVGANTGVYALAAKAFNPKAEINAFEPVARVFNKLKANIDLNEYLITLHNIGLSNFQGTATVFTEGQEHVYSVTVNKDISNNSNPKQKEKIIVDRMDNIFNEVNFPDLIKIDVETHEPEVIEGMGKMLSGLPTMLIEVLTDQVAEKLNELISQHNYLIYDVPDNKPVRKLQKIQKATHYNLLLCRQEIAIGLNLDA